MDRRRSLRLISRVGDQFSIRDARVADTELENPIEKQAPTTRRTPVETEQPLVEMLLKVLPGHSPLVGRQQPALDKRSDPINTRQKIVQVRALPQRLGA